MGCYIYDVEPTQAEQALKVVVADGTPLNRHADGVAMLTLVAPVLLMTAIVLVLVLTRA
jgi:hypothetical protein